MGYLKPLQWIERKPEAERQQWVLITFAILAQGANILLAYRATTTQGEVWNFPFSSKPHVGQMCGRVGNQAVAFFQAALHPAHVKQK
jgi:hypothetical protein